MALNPADIVAGKPTKEEIFQEIDSVLTDHENRLDLLDGDSQFDLFNVNFTGRVDEYSVAIINQRCPIYKAPAAGSIVSVVVTLLEASTSGTLSLDIQKSTDNGQNWNSVLSSSVDLTGLTVGSLSGAVNFVVGGEVVTQNELYRIQLTSIQVGQGDFHVSIYGERT